MSIEQLNADYGIADQLKFSQGKGGFPLIEINNQQAKALISVYGGQVLSFQPTDEPEDLMFVSENAYYQEGKAIKGGIPICWPWFGPDPEGLGRSSHGFVRNRQWQVAATETTREGETKVRFELSDSEETREIWPHRFELAIEILIGNTLTVELITRNIGKQTFSITQGLHSYFKVGDIDQVKVLGLEGTKYIDKVDNHKEKNQEDRLTIAEEVDRIYTNVQPELTIEDGSLSRRIQIKSDGSRTAVVWNPWVEISKKMADLEEEDYKHFICVETVNTATEVVEVSPDSEYRLRANYSVNR